MKTYELMDQLGRSTREFELPLRELETRLADVAAQEAQTEARIAQALSTLGSMHLEHNGDIGQEAATVLELRAAEEREQRAWLKGIESEIADLLEQVRAAHGDADQASARVREHLYGDPAFVEAIKTRNAAAAAQARLEQHGADLWAECERKLPGFEQQRLYTYLLNAGYGEPDYRAQGMTRVLDGWIGRLCNFAENRRNHLALLGMRDELSRQRHTLADQLASADKVLAPLSAQAERKAGLDAARERLRQLERQVELAKGRANQMHDKLSAYADGKDARYVRARELVTRRLREQSIDKLMEQARATPMLADDEVVHHLSELYEQRRSLQQQQHQLAERRSETYAQYERAKALERDLRHHRQYMVHGRYDNGMDWAGLFMGYMAGAMTSHDVTRVLGEHLQREAGYGEDGFGWSAGQMDGSGADDEHWRRTPSALDFGHSAGGSDSYSSSDSSGGGDYSTSDSF
jgi:DNA repair exonuclease SbcCD ATPase subunit